jgi:L-fuculose-phosphate aldolase
MEIEVQLKQEIVRICRLLHARGLIAATDGNVSARIGDRLLLTPSGVNKGVMAEGEVITVDLAGKVIAGWGSPTSEIQMHLAAYARRPDIKAVVHAHPPLATACSLSGISLLTPMLPEVVLTLGGIPTVPYATPTTREVPEALEEWLASYDALILMRHGAVTLGRDLMEAYNRMEKLEHTAHILLMAHLAGQATPMSPEELQKLAALGGPNKKGPVCC